MFDYFKDVSYPLQDTDVLASADDAQIDLLKQALIDYKVQVYNAISSEAITATVKDVRSGEQLIRFTLALSDSSGGVELLGVFNSSSDDFIRFHFSADASDIATADSFLGTWQNSNIHISGFFCFKGLGSFTTGQINTTGLEFALEPSRIAVFSKHRVDSIVCQNALPLLVQTVTNRYEDPQAPALGHVKLQAGNNCLISIQPALNTVVISAQNQANDTSSEVCGVWKDKVSDKDILCNEVVYSISGVEPDNNGDIKVAGDAPVTVNALPLEDLPEPFINKIQNSQESFSDIIRYIYIGLPKAGDSSVFDCPTV